MITYPLNSQSCQTGKQVLSGSPTELARCSLFRR
jgi:hypothetical protein